MLSLLLILAASHVVPTHSFYDPVCCSDNDCAPIASQRVTERGNGYAVDGTAIPQNLLRQSPDGQYHLCQPKGGAVRCLYVIPRGV